MRPGSRKICIVTGTRAEYGLLVNLMKEVKADPALTLQVVATGAHLSERFGSTVRDIESDGFTVDARVDIELADDTRLSVARSTGLGIERLAAAFDALQPDVVVVLGDRYEILSAATAAMLLAIPLAHIHGGEITQGAMDDAIRHAITKMSQLHFTVSETYYNRVVQMGEAPAQVFMTGAPGLDNLKSLSLLDRPALDEAIGFDLGEAYFLVTYHPETRPKVLDKEVGDRNAIMSLFRALNAFSAHQILVTGVNADPGGGEIERLIAQECSRQSARVFSTSSLGQLRYLSAMKHATAVVGNSSSGIIEAPALGVPTVNIGIRQAGRIRAASVIDCDPTEESIRVALRRSLDSEFQKQARSQPYPFGVPGASLRIKEILKSTDLDDIITTPFYDINLGVEQKGILS